MPSDVAEPCGTEQRIADRMEQNVRVGVAKYSCCDFLLPFSIFTFNFLVMMISSVPVPPLMIAVNHVFCTMSMRAERINIHSNRSIIHLWLKRVTHP
jgi:hypothetical protein